MSKINIDIDILEGTNPNYLSIVDTSEWGVLESNPAIIYITLPGYSTPIENYFEKKSLNIFNAFNLKILCKETCDDCDYIAIPDGIYTIKIESHSNCNFNVEKKYLRTNILEREIDQLIIDNLVCDTYSTEKEQLITKLEFILKSAKANLRYDNVNLAQQLFNQACSIVKKIKNCR